MFQFDWSNRREYAKEPALGGPIQTRLPRDIVAQTMLLHWQEHCLECAPPQCYSSCALFEARSDRKCARLAYGIARNDGFAGLLDYGADLRFRRWAKIEAELRPRGLSVATHRLLSRLDRVVTGIVNAISTLLTPLSPFRRLNGALTVFRDRLLKALTAAPETDYEEFVMECFLAGDQPGRILLELWNGRTQTFCEAIALKPGNNFVTLPASRVLASVDLSLARITLYPENDANLRVVFSWLDFIKYHPSTKAQPTSIAVPAAKVKCVAWDLDNTLWHGVLVEDGVEALTLRAGIQELMRNLDERGILQTVVSKNDHAAAWDVVKRFGLADYLLYPAINWGAKSTNLVQVAKQLNIGIDSFALVDDSSFERAEVQATLPMVRVLDEREIDTLLSRPEFDAPITEMSRRRRSSYFVEVQRLEAQQLFPGDYTDFLRACGMKLRVFSPRAPEGVKRCLELVQRSNQLNLSSRRFDAEEFAEFINTDGVLCVAMECSDRFGEYGIVGFVSVDERGLVPRMTNFVLSCRIAQKRVEHAFLRWLASRERARGCDRLEAELVVTSRNGPLVAVFDDLRFERVQTDGGRVLLVLALSVAPAADEVVSVEVAL
jgi:FkbH-like protein